MAVVAVTGRSRAQAIAGGAGIAAGLVVHAGQRWLWPRRKPPELPQARAQPPR